MKNSAEKVKIYYVPEKNNNGQDNIINKNKKYERHYNEIPGNGKINKYETEDKSKKMDASYISNKYKMVIYQSVSFILILAVIITGMIISKIQNFPDYMSDVGSAASLNRDSKILNNMSPAVYDKTNDIYVKAEEDAKNAANRNTVNSVSSSEEVLNYVKKYNMKYINQDEDKMPNGCEVVSLAMVLSRYIPNISAHEIYLKYMPLKSLPSFHNGVYIGEDPSDYYIGNPEGMGYGIFAPGLVKTAQNTLDAYKTAKTAVNISGCSEQELFDYVRQYPVIVWCTMNLLPVNWGFFHWYLPDGKIYQYPGNEHCCVLVDYTETTVKLYDPRNGIADYDRALFLQRWNELGPYKDQTRQAVIIK